jgi:hypothetical protein
MTNRLPHKHITSSFTKEKHMNIEHPFVRFIIIGILIVTLIMVMT